MRVHAPDAPRRRRSQREHGRDARLMPTSRRHLVLYGVLAAAAAAVIVFGLNDVYGYLNSSAGASGSQRTATVAQGIVQASVSASGNVGVATSAAVNFATSGTLTRVEATVGEKVKVGQPLAGIDPTSAQDALMSAKANLQQAQSTLATSQEGLTASQQASNTVSLQQAQSTITTDEQQLASDETTLATAKAQVATDESLSCPAPTASGSGASAASGSGSILEVSPRRGLRPPTPPPWLPAARPRPRRTPARSEPQTAPPPERDALVRAGPRRTGHLVERGVVERGVVERGVDVRRLLERWEIERRRRERRLGRGLDLDQLEQLLFDRRLRNLDDRHLELRRTAGPGTPARPRRRTAGEPREREGTDLRSASTRSLRRRPGCRRPQHPGALVTDRASPSPPSPPASRPDRPRG